MHQLDIFIITFILLLFVNINGIPKYMWHGIGYDKIEIICKIECRIQDVG